MGTVVEGSRRGAEAMSVPPTKESGMALYAQERHP
jgi:hypothetical protein